MDGESHLPDLGRRRASGFAVRGATRNVGGREVMAATAQASRTSITLKGSTKIVTEFFGYSINSILYQRGIYPPESFSASEKYGLRMLVTTDAGLVEYLDQVLTQLSEWLMTGHVQCLVLVISSQLDGATLERWVFDIVTEMPGEGGDGDKRSSSSVPKSEKEIMREIQAIMRQITSSVTFLPLLDVPCSFDLLIHTDLDTQVPKSWEESDPKYISNSAEVKLRSFTTKIHRVDAMVSYKNPDAEPDD
ncbi:HORMA domain-containing protein [Plasmodiophora brassicae]|uniref:HORMA domain-containing protein n=1 Tax=Plasmodiophora brassicae TaxID=37360 RepID=A0A0G4IK25_PLABS|nr:hypothetical protein PBRA_004277 [Plasmodiophora brassicae]SPR00425.1 unnamed protein product [Plasmodiophora brassicae]